MKATVKKSDCRHLMIILANSMLICVERAAVVVAQHDSVTCTISQELCACAGAEARNAECIEMLKGSSMLALNAAMFAPSAIGADCRDASDGDTFIDKLLLSKPVIKMKFASHINEQCRKCRTAKFSFDKCIDCNRYSQSELLVDECQRSMPFCYAVTVELPPRDIRLLLANCDSNTQKLNVYFMVENFTTGEHLDSRLFEPILRNYKQLEIKFAYINIRNLATTKASSAAGIQKLTKAKVKTTSKRHLYHYAYTAATTNQVTANNDYMAISDYEAPAIVFNRTGNAAISSKITPQSKITQFAAVLIEFCVIKFVLR